ncbi:hypothetical protein [Microbacterium sp. NPDC087868]|uniref:hypothetical protein n=1 Tax=Microbacterium sp. NPDC087868 TaxID=3364195 RepID=UPI00384B0948
MQWGWNPDSIAALTTALAAVAAVVAGYFAWKAYQAESDARGLAIKAHDLAERAHDARIEREQLLEKEKERAQAEMVSAWAVVVEAGGEKCVEVHVQNLSPAPVYSVRLGFELAGSPNLYAGWARVLPPTPGVPERPKVHDDATRDWRIWGRRRGRHAAPYVELTFHDASGRWWYRDGHGVLAETTEKDAWRYKKSTDKAPSPT